MWGKGLKGSEWQGEGRDGGREGGREGREGGRRERSQASQMLFNRAFGGGKWETKNMEKQIALWVEGKESLSQGMGKGTRQCDMIRLWGAQPGMGKSCMLGV